MSVIANNLLPFRATHPGEVIKDEIEYRGLSQRRLAQRTGIPLSAINDILNAKRPLTAEYALLIGAALNIDAEPLLKMQAKYNLVIACHDKKLSDRLAQIRKVCAAL